MPYGIRRKNHVTLTLSRMRYLTKSIIKVGGCEVRLHVLVVHPRQRSKVQLCPEMRANLPQQFG